MEVSGENITNKELSPISTILVSGCLARLESQNYPVLGFL